MPGPARTRSPFERVHHREVAIDMPASFNVDVRNGVVPLKGNGDTAAQARSAESLARNVSGVSSVRNDLRVAGR